MEKIKIASYILITLFFISINSMLASAQSGVSLSISPNNIHIVSGIESKRSISVFIKNEQNISDNFEIFIAGSYPYRELVHLSQKVIKLSPNEQKIIRIDLTVPKKSAPGKYNLEISISSKTNTSIWSSEKVEITISQAQQQSYAHDQPSTETVSVVKPESIGINYYGNLRLIDRGYIINNQGECCTDSKMKLDSLSLSGEWFTKGGPRDSPPIEWVDNLEEVKRKIDNREFTTTVYDALVCNWRAVKEKETGPERCEVRAALICSSSCKLLPSSKVSLDSTNNEIIVKEEGTHTLEYDCPVDCIFFIDRRNMTSKHSNKLLSDVYGYAEIKGNLKNIKQSIMVRAKKGERGPDLELISSKIGKESLKEGEKFYIKLKIKNIGDKEAKLDKIFLNINNYEFVYSPKTLKPGEEGEILIKARADNITTLNIDFNYRADSIGCLKTLNFKEKFSIGNIRLVGKLKKCGAQADCSSQEICCEGYCMSKAEGFCDDLDGDGTPETWVSYK